MRCFLLTGRIDGIDLCVAGMEIHFHHLTLHISQKYFNILKNTLYVEKSVVDQVIIFNKSLIT